MSVIAEFTIEADQFVLGQVLGRDPTTHIEIERVVPASRQIMPYLWVSGGDFDRFEAEIEGSEHVRSIRALDRVGDTVLYRIEWDEAIESLIHGMAETDATILEAFGNEQWKFRIRFADHAGLTDFHNYCLDHDIVFVLDRVYTLTEDHRGGIAFDLTEPQREALVRAVEGGYFEVPRGITLGDLAADLDISQQAASERVRRAADKVLRAVLLERPAQEFK